MLDYDPSGMEVENGNYEDNKNVLYITHWDERGEMQQLRVSRLEGVRLAKMLLAAAKRPYRPRD